VDASRGLVALVVGIVDPTVVVIVFGVLGDDEEISQIGVGSEISALPTTATGSIRAFEVFVGRISFSAIEDDGQVGADALVGRCDGCDDTAGTQAHGAIQDLTVVESCEIDQ